MTAELLFAEAVLGRDAQDFIDSELGRFIFGRCEQEIAEARQKLDVVSPWRRNRIRQLQNEIWRAKSMRSWLIELLQAGQQAEQMLDEEDE